MSSLHSRTCCSFAYLGLYLALYCLVVLCSLTGDYVFRLPRKSSVVSYAIALSDTAVHGSIGALSWWMVVVLQLGATSLARYVHFPVIRDILLCGLLSSAIDLDHAIAARGFSIKSLTTLTKRPLFHNTTLLLSLSLVLILLGYSFSSNKQQLSITTRLGCLLLVATVTHHLRDAIRHGFNLYPVWPRATAAVPLVVYFIVLLVLPALLVLLLSPFGGDSLFGYDDQSRTVANDSAQIRYSALSQEAPESELAESIV